MPRQTNAKVISHRRAKLTRALWYGGVFVVAGAAHGQTNVGWNTANTDGLWSGTRWLDNGTPVAITASNWIFFNNNTQPTMTMDLSGTALNQYRMTFQSGASTARTITGSNTITYFDFSGNAPQIINDSSATHVLNFNIANGNTSGSNRMEFYANSGGLQFGPTTSTYTLSGSGSGTRIFAFKPSTGRTITINNSIVNGGTTLNLAVEAGNTGAGIVDYTNNTAPTHAATSITGGATLRFRPTAAGGTWAFGSGTISINSGTFAMNGNTANTFTLSNAFDIGSNGGTIDFGRVSSNPVHVFSGAVNLGGNLTLSSSTGSTATWAGDFTNTFTLSGGNRTVTIANPSSGAPLRVGSFTQDSSSRTLTVSFASNNAQPVTFNGDNSGLTGGISLSIASGTPMARAIFNSENALGGGGAGNFAIASNTYAGLNFSVTTTALQKIASGSAGSVGIEANSTVNVDLSASGLNRDLRIGSSNAAGATLTGTVTPFGSTYKFGGGGGVLVLASTNALTGSNTLDVNFQGNVGGSTLALASSNNFSGGTTVNGSSSTVSNTLALRANGAAGSGSITLVSSATGSPTLRFDTNAQTQANSVVISGTATANITTNAATQLDGVVSQGSATLVYGGNSLLVRTAVTNGTGATTLSGGALGISNLNQLASGALAVSGGVLVLDGVAWSNAGGTGLADLRAVNFTAGGFAARGSPVTIGSTGTTASTFDRDATFGSALTDVNGNAYANESLTVARDTTLSASRVWTIATNGGGYSSGSTLLNQYSGNLSGPGALIVTGADNASTSGTLVLSGANAWTGSPTVQINGTGAQLNAGPGGMNVRNALVRFVGDASLPAGNGGSSAYVAAIQRNSSSPFGYLLTGDADGELYDLPNGYRFMIGAMSSNPSSGTLGSEGGSATLRGSTVLVHSGNNTTDALSLVLLARDGATLTLGATGNPVKFVSTTGQDTTATTTATVATDATGNRVLVKRGEGTVVLGNVAYTKLDGTTDASANFIAGGFQIGRGTSGNSGGSAYFDGAVRGRAFGDAGANNSNSLKSFFLQLRGGVYEIDNSGGGSGSFTAAIATNGAGAVSIGNVSGTNGLGGGGFSAYGGDVTVTLTGSAVWGVSGSGFVQNNDSLIFGSQTTNAALTFASFVGLNAGTREVRVIDNASSTNDLADMTGGIAGTSTASNLVKAGAGTLRLANNLYGGSTAISAGTVLLNSNDNAAAPLSVGSTATGTDTITINGHGLAAGQRVGIDGTGVIGGTSRDAVYYVVNPTANTFQLALSAGGSAVDLTSGGTAPVVVQAGALGSRIATAVTLGDANTGANSVALLTDGAFTIARNVVVSSNGTGTATLGGNAAAASTFSGTVSLNKSVVLSQVSGGTVTFSSAISDATGTNALTKSGAGTVILSGANTYAGTTTISAGTLQIGSGGTNGSLGSGNVVNNASLVFNRSNDFSVSNVISGTGLVEKAGAGTLTLSGTLTYTGVTTVTAGTLLVNGTLDAQTSAVSVANNATIGGTGTINRPVTIANGGKLAPGASPGTLTVGGALTLNDSSVLDYELLATDTSVNTGVNDLTVANAGLTLDGILNVTSLGGDFSSVTMGTKWRLFNYSGSFADNGLTLGTLPTLGGGLGWGITFAAGQVNLEVVPEPAVIVGALLIGAASLKRRRITL